MPHLLLIARHYHPTPGAASNRLLALVAALAHEGWTITVITRKLDKTATQSQRGPSGEKILRVPGDVSSGIHLRRLVSLVLFPMFAVMTALWRVRKVDVVMADPPPTTGPALLVLARRFGARSVYYFADSWATLVGLTGSDVGRVLRPAVAMLEHLVLKRSDMVLAVTRGLYQEAAALNPHVRHIPNGVDGSLYGCAEDTAPFEFDPGMPYFLYAGNFGAAHGATIFARAASAEWETEDAEDFALVFMGYGSEGEALRRVAEDWPGRILVLPPQPPEVAALAFRKAVAGLASIQDDLELSHAVPVKALASIMSGCPLVYVGPGEFGDEVVAEGYGVRCLRAEVSVGQAMRSFVQEPWDNEARRALAKHAAGRYDNRTAALGLVAELAAWVESGVDPR